MNREHEFVMTSVLGHICEKDFPDQYRKWRNCPPKDLFHLPVETNVTKDKISIKENLQNQARYASHIFIWTDCDREGEAIGAEVVRIVQSANPRIQVLRARFSSIIPR